MGNYIHYEDIPKGERKQLTKDVCKKNKSVRLWSGLAGGLGVGVGLTISDNAFPDQADWPGELIISIMYCVGLTVLFHEAVVKPKIIRLIEKQKNS